MFGLAGSAVQTSEVDRAESENLREDWAGCAKGETASWHDDNGCRVTCVSNGEKC